MKAHDIFKVLGDATRLRIVVLLLERELCVCDILAVLQLPQSTVSRHMARLRSSGIVLDRRDGKWVHYQLAETPLVSELRRMLQENLANTDPYRRDLATLKGYVESGQCAATA